MILKLTRGLPRTWSKHPAAAGVLLEKDIGVGHGKLRAKLMVFKNAGCLRAFWRGLNKSELGRGCLGAVNGLFTENIVFRKGKEERRFLECDPRYFCVIGMVKGHLTMEVICHESVHAAFNYEKRRNRAPWSHLAKDFDEEGICYPAGRIAAAINRALHRAKLY